MSFRISICIPTYNRSDQLDRLLSFICPIISKIEPETIEVCVSDNASTDNTSIVLKKYIEKYRFLASRRNEKNIGFSRNLDAVANMANGDYLYLTGDDDSFCFDGVEILLRKLNQYKGMDLLLFNSHKSIKSAAIRKNEDICLNSLNEYFRQLGIFHATFIGNLCFRKTAFIMSSKNDDARNFSAYPHMFNVFDILKNGSCVFINASITLPDDKLRSWNIMQPVYTSIDMARIVKQVVFPFIGLKLRMYLKLQLGKSLVRAIYRQARGIVKVDNENPFQSLTINNIYDIYA